MKSSIRTFSNSGNELLPPFAKRLDPLQSFFPTNLLAFGPLDFDFLL